MTNANITSEKWILDADLEGQKSEQVRRKKGWPSTFALAYSAVGVVYGDVGTSPLYVFSSTFTTDTPTETDVLGAMSIIFWTITLIVVVKYMLIVLLADDNGEGQYLPWTCLKVLVNCGSINTQLQVPHVMLREAMDWLPACM
ncbi:hypothetical protein ABBQ38_006590 [Trebouxia sp. C0009 RCD-2024]